MHLDYWHIIQLFKHFIFINAPYLPGNYSDIKQLYLIDFLYLIVHTKSFYVQ